jgi:hypothetical protein
MLGLNPILIPIIPQVGLIYVIFKLYQKRADDLASGRPLQPPHMFGTPPNLNPSTAELKQNYQQIQNTMLNMSNAYDVGYNFYRLLDWTDFNMTNRILKWTLLSLFMTLLVSLVVPLNYLFLFGGVLVLVLNTPLVRAATKTLVPVITDKLTRRVDKIRRIINEARRTGRKAVIAIEVYENQRWWAGTIPLI